MYQLHVSCQISLTHHVFIVCVAETECRTVRQITTPSTGWNVRHAADTSVEGFWRWEPNQISAGDVVNRHFATQNSTTERSGCWLRRLRVINVIRIEQLGFLFIYFFLSWAPFKPRCASGSERLQIGGAIGVLFLTKPNQNKFSRLFVRPAKRCSACFGTASWGTDEQNAGRRQAARLYHKSALGAERKRRVYKKIWGQRASGKDGKRQEAEGKFSCDRNALLWFCCYV